MFKPRTTLTPTGYRAAHRSLAPGFQVYYRFERHAGDTRLVVDMPRLKRVALAVVLVGAIFIGGCGYIGAITGYWVVPISGVGILVVLTAVAGYSIRKSGELSWRGPLVVVNKDTAQVHVGNQCMEMPRVAHVELVSVYIGEGEGSAVEQHVVITERREHGCSHHLAVACQTGAAKIAEALGAELHVPVVRHRIAASDKQHRPPDVCDACGYSMSGLSTERCPECGTFDPARVSEPSN